MSNHEPLPGEIRIRRGRHELVAVDNVFVVDGKVFDLSTVDRVIYRAATRINQHAYELGVAQGESKCRFLFNAYRRGTEMAETRELWNQAVALLERTVCPRIADDAARTISAGGSVTFGGPQAARIVADAEGVRKLQPFAEKVPWNRIVGSDFALGQVRLWSGDRTGTSKPRLSIDMGGWNAVVLPRLVAMLGSH